VLVEQHGGLVSHESGTVLSLDWNGWGGVSWRNGSTSLKLLSPPSGEFGFELQRTSPRVSFVLFFFIAPELRITSLAYSASPHPDR
jgi:hypothetical protein